MRKKISLTGYKLRKGRKTIDTVAGQNSFILAEGRALVNAANKQDKWAVQSANTIDFLTLVGHARKRGLRLTPVYSRA